MGTEIDTTKEMSENDCVQPGIEPRSPGYRSDALPLGH